MECGEGSLVVSESSTRVPETGRSGWTIETAIDYLLSIINEKYSQTATTIQGNDRRYEERFLALKSENSLALSAAERAVLKAEIATEKRFESVNEFRGTLDSQQRTLIPRSEVSVLVDGLNEKINGLAKIVDEQKAVITKLQAERQGVVGGWGYAAGLIGVLLALGSLIVMGIKFVQTSP
jgi:hypothetical protein